MNNLSVADLAQSWYRNSQRANSTDPSSNKLFEMLYNTHCRRHGIDRSFSRLSFENGDHYKARAQLFNWYTDRYGSQLGMPTGSQGQKRTVGRDDDAYTFDRLYCDDRQFRNYLETGLPQSGSQDLLAFVLHTAVAFMVSPGELDAVLQHLGFHPLHVKNIHHLSIAYVLLMADHRSLEDGYNPFAEVKGLYFKALEILNAPGAPAEESYSYADLETRMIRDILLLRKGLASQNFEALVARNRDALNKRHSMILEDFHRLSAVFIHLYDSNAAPDCCDQPEQAYSFYRFVARFCRADLSRKKYREQLTSMIDLNLKHPTRNILILLWLYAYCFCVLPSVYIDKRTFGRITKMLKKADPKWVEEAKACYHNNMFNVYGFIMDQPGFPGAPVFRGSDFVTFINEKLLLRYGWGPLNEKLPFDRYIYDLEKLMLQIAPSGQCSRALYDGYPMGGFADAVDNVPFPLVAITQFFQSLEQIHIQKAAQAKYTKISPCPLKCSLYEQL